MNALWGGVALAAAALLLAAAWRLHRRGRSVAAAVAITGAGLVLRLYAGSDLFLHAWDERFHALVAKHLAEHPLRPTLYEHPVLPYDYRDWRANHVWLHKPPLALWLMAAAIRLLGTGELAMRLPSLALSTLAVFLTYAIGAGLCGRRAGLLGAALHAVHGYLLQLPAGRVAVDHVDNALVFFVELGIFLAVLQAHAATRPREPAPPAASRAAWWLWLPAIGAACGLAVLAKWLPGLLPIPVWLALTWRRQPRHRVILGLAAISAVSAAVVVPWQLHVRRAFPLEAAWEASYNLRHLVVPIEGLGGSPLYYLLKMPRYFGELAYLPLAWLLWQLLRRARALRQRRPARERPAAGPDLAPLAVWLLLPYLAFSLAATKLGGYVMIAAPACFLVTACFWLWLWRLRPGGRARAALRLAVLILLPLLPLRYTVERLKVRAAYDRNPAWARALRALPERLGPGPVVLFHLPEPLEAMYYTSCVAAYEGVPTPTQARRLLDAGYRVVVLDADAAPPSLGRIPGVEMRREAIPLAPLDDGTGFRLPRTDGSDSPLAGMPGARRMAGPDPAPP